MIYICLFMLLNIIILIFIILFYEKAFKSKYYKEEERRTKAWMEFYNRLAEKQEPYINNNSTPSSKN